MTLADALAKQNDPDAAVEAPPSTVAQMLDGIMPQLTQALGARLDPARFARVVIQETHKNPALLRCNPRSLLGAVLTAAQLGLEPGPLQLAYLIPRQTKGKWEVQFQLGYRGMIELALRGGRTLSIDAHVVRADDDFVIEYGTAPRLVHRPKMYGPNDERAPVVCVWAAALLPGGGAPFTHLDLAEIARRRAHAADNSPAWRSEWDAMARKTAVRALAPYLPQTAELAAAQRLDDTVRTDLAASFDTVEVEHVDNEAVEAPE
jgi:recombination protein RecT